jgi:hypothetical protein
MLEKVHAFDVVPEYTPWANPTVDCVVFVFVVLVDDEPPPPQPHVIKSAKQIKKAKDLCILAPVKVGEGNGRIIRSHGWHEIQN